LISDSFIGIAYFLLRFNMYELGPPNFLRTILILTVIWYGGKFLLKWWLKSKMASAMKEQERSVSEDEAAFKNKDAGKIHIKKEKTPTHSSNCGEYIDYEEVD